MSTTTALLDVELSADLLTLIADRSAASDESGHQEPDVTAALAATGINRLLLPTELGGLSAPPRRAVELVERLAIVDGSVAWTAAIGFGSNHFAGYLPPDGAAEVFDDPDKGGAAMFAPIGRLVDEPDGTLRLNGRWPFASNCEQAAWAALGTTYRDELAPRLVLVPRSELTIHPTWDVAGLRATASNDVSVDDLQVELRHTCSFADRPWAEGPLWRLPLFVVLAPPIAAVMLGIARGALDDLNQQAVSRRAQMRGTLLDDAVGMADIGAADVRLRAARAGLLASLDECWDRAVDGERTDRSLQARTFLASQHCADVAVEVCATAHRLAGGAGAYRNNPQLRALRDVETARQHAMFSHGFRAPLARIIAGTDEARPPFVI
jgi:alkylation response protein AidB-like acyl-CoA dehydrogenase